MSESSSKPNLERSARDLNLLLEINQILDESLDLHEVVNPVLETLTAHLKMDQATLTLLNRKTDEVMIEAACGLSPSQTARGRYKLGEGVTGQVVLTGEPAVIKKTSESDLFLNRTKGQRDKEYTFLCVPIKDNQQVIGALSATREYEPGTPLEEMIQLMQLVVSMISQAVKLRRSAQERSEKLAVENELLRAELKDKFRPSNIIGNSHEMQNVYEQIAQVSNSAASVLIFGDTGTGKELVAHAIHYNSARADKPFVKAHCAALPESVIESELFGHVKGAFTGAVSDRKGRFELAHGGTLFLDEIGEIPITIQIKLLRVLQEREFEPVGSTKTIKVNVRVIAATNRDLPQLSAEGLFREDLYYRLNVFPIYVPSLSKRKSDILLLADFFLEKYAHENVRQVRRLSSAAIDMLYAYHWPGNVRELENAIERAVLVAEGDVIHPHHLPPSLQTAEANGDVHKGTLCEMVDAFEHDVIMDALKSSRGNMAAAARILDTTPRIFGYKVHKYKIDPKKYSS